MCVDANTLYREPIGDSKTAVDDFEFDSMRHDSCLTVVKTNVACEPWMKDSDKRMRKAW